MSQVNILAMDLSKGTENIGSQSYGKDSEYQANSNFSDVMAKHQQSKSGNDPQKSGNSSNRAEQESSIERAESRGYDIKNNSQVSTKENNQALANEQTAEQSAADAKGKLVDSVDTQVSKSQHNEINTENESSIDNQATEDFDIAKQLLSFIVASDGVSTQHSDPKLTDNAKNITESAYSDTVLKNGALLEELTGKSESEVKTALENSMKDGASSNTNTGHSAEKSALEQLKGDLSNESSVEKNTRSDAKAAQANEQLTAGKNSTTQTAAEIVDKSVASLTELKSAVGENIAHLKDAKPAVDEPLSQKELAAQKLAEKSASGQGATLSSENNELAANANTSTNAQAQQITQNGASAESIPLENGNTAKNSQQSENTAQSKEALKELSSDILTSTVERQANEQKSAEVNASDVRANEAKVTDNNMRSADRVINQATASVMQNNAQMGQGQSQSGESHLNQSQQSQAQANEQAKILPEEVISEKKAAITNAQTEEKIATSFIEQKVSQTIHSNEMKASTLNQQTTFAEEQVIQNIVAKANADSMSVQSAKTASNIHSETIAIYRKDFSNAVKDKVMVMINQKIKQLEIRLDPPELGSMQVRLNLQNEQAAVNFVVQNQQAKEALEQNMDKLKDMLAQSGVDVGDANIEQRDKQASEQDETGNGRQSAGVNENDIADEQTVMSGANLYKASATGVDYYA